MQVAVLRILKSFEPAADLPQNNICYCTTANICIP